MKALGGRSPVCLTKTHCAIKAGKINESANSNLRSEFNVL